MEGNSNLLKNFTCKFIGHIQDEETYKRDHSQIFSPYERSLFTIRYNGKILVFHSHLTHKPIHIQTIF